MIKPNAIVIESGDLHEKEEVLVWLKEQQNYYHGTLFIGTGKQTNEACAKAGYARKMCPVGRVFEDVKHKELCESVAREVQALVQDNLDRHGITFRVLIPFDMADDVITPVNGDVAMFSKYQGYDVTFRLTEKSRVAEKEQLIRNVAKAFRPIAGENGIDLALSKIKVVGF